MRKSKAAWTFEPTIAVETAAAVWLHILGAGKAHQVAAATAGADSSIKGVTWRADKHVVLGRKAGKKGKAKHFQVPLDATEEDKEAISAKAQDWVNADDDADEQEDEEDESDAAEDEEGESGVAAGFCAQLARYPRKKPPGYYKDWVEC